MAVYRRRTGSAKSYAKKYPKGGYSKKYSTGKKRSSYPKKGGTGKSSSYSKNVLRSVVKEMLRGPPQKVLLKGVPDQVVFFDNAPMNDCCYFRVPVSQAIPNQRGANAAPDSRWRESNKILIKGVSFRSRIDFTGTCEVMAVVYPAKIQTQSIPLRGSPAAEFYFGQDEKNFPGGTRLLTLNETGLLNSSKEGPFAVVPGADGSLFVDSADRSLFECRLSTGPSAPVGEARWKKSMDSKEVTKGRTYYQQFSLSSGMAQRDSRSIQVYWDINKEVEFVSSGSDSLIMDPHLELLVGVRGVKTSSLLRSKGELDDLQRLGGVLRNVVVDVYYSMA
jgi:hypothetical protein